MLDEIRTYEFISSVGVLSMVTSLITLIIMYLIKVILRKTKVINESIDAIRKDVMLSRIGRITCGVIYISLYVMDAMFIKKTQIIFDVKLITSLISGIVSTLIVTKGLYTMIRQMEKKESVYEKLEVANNTIEELTSVIKTKSEKESAKEKIVNNFWPMNNEE